MAIIKPFKGLRPIPELAQKLSSRPYDVLSSEEARKEAEGNEYSLYHIIKPEIDFPVGTDEHDERVYAKAAENFHLFCEKGWLLQDPEPEYYIYSQRMGDHVQYGFVVAASVSDYMSGVIKKHELTRIDKEEDRMKHVRVNDANIEPVFLAFPDDDVLLQIQEQIIKQTPIYDFVSEDEIGHRLWPITDTQVIALITERFRLMPALYIADGHHRTAAAARVGAEKAAQNPSHTGKEEYNYFMAVCFPSSQLNIMDYNRVVKDLNGMTPEAFLEALKEYFDVEDKGIQLYKPTHLHNFSLYLQGRWYSLTAHENTYCPSDPIGSLDVTISSDLILNNLLGITNLRADKRIDFVGGIRGLEELKCRVDSGEMAMALALYPVSMSQLMTIADTGNIMPPKTTWFEPKLRSGLIIHKLDD